MQVYVCVYENADGQAMCRRAVTEDIKTTRTYNEYNRTNKQQARVRTRPSQSPRVSTAHLMDVRHLLSSQNSYILPSTHTSRISSRSLLCRGEGAETRYCRHVSRLYALLQRIGRKVAQRIRVRGTIRAHERLHLIPILRL